MEQLQAQHERLLSHVKTPFERSLMAQINWQSRLIAIRGARGVGKTTMLLQHIKKNIRFKSTKGIICQHGSPVLFASYALGVGGGVS